MMTPSAEPDASPPRRCGLAVLLAGFFTLYLAMGLRDPMVHVTDFFGHCGTASAIGHAPLSRINSPWYPIGYPFVLKAAIAIAGQPVRAARFLSASFATLALWALFRLGCNLTGETVLALAVAAATGLAPPFLQSATAEGTDMPCVASLLWSAAFLTGAAPSVRAAGFAMGLAYDFRFATMAPALAQVVWLAVLGVPGPKPACSRARALASFLVAALLAASPQLALSLAAHGTPFHSYMAKNVWFGIYGENNWQSKWDLMPDDIGLAAVIRLSPSRFLSHWAGNLGSLAVGSIALPEKITGHGINWLLPFGAIHVAWKLGRPAVGFWYWVTAAYTVALAMAFLGPRYFLPLVPALALAGLWFLWDMLPAQSNWRGHAFKVRWLGLAILLAVKVPLDLSGALKLPASTREALAIEAALKRAGMRSTSEVLATNGDYYDLVTLGRFDRWESNKPEPVRDVHGLVTMMLRRGYRFVLYDRDYGQRRVLPHLKELLTPDRIHDEKLKCIAHPPGADGAVVYELMGAASSS